MWTVPAKKLIETAHAASDEATRYYLQGVCISAPDGNGDIWLTATDGHIMSVHRLTEGADGDQIASKRQIIISSEAIKQIAGMLKSAIKGHRYAAEQALVRLEYTTPATADGRSRPMRISLAASDGVVLSVIETPAEIDGTFPDWPRVLPDTSVPGTPPSFGVNPAQLIRLQKACGGHHIAITFGRNEGGPNHQQAPSLVTASAAPGWYGVIMPMRAEPVTAINKPKAVAQKRKEAVAA